LQSSPFHFFAKHVQTIAEYDELYDKGGEYYDKMIYSFGLFGIDESNITFIHYFKDDIQTIERKINEADVIYLPGGAPDLFMERLYEKKMIKLIENQKNKILMGSSAGSMIQFSSFHISPDHDYKKFSLNQGLDFISTFNVEVHYRRRKKQKAALRRVFKKDKKPLFAIPDDGAIIYDGFTVKCVHAAHQLYDHKGVIRRK
jgi:peptidase E